MRITAHLDRYDRHNPDACAIVWLDTQSGKWSREGHVGAGVPPWGHAGHASDGTCAGTPRRTSIFRRSIRRADRMRMMSCADQVM